MINAWNKVWSSIAELFDMLHNGCATGNAYSRIAREYAEGYEALTQEERKSELASLKAKLKAA